MAYVIGIDTGGTYTDAVLLDNRRVGAESIISKAKAFTTHENLEEGINNSIVDLHLSDEQKKNLDKVVLSTTLATNAIVENKLCSVGLILLGDTPRGEIATEHISLVDGTVSIQGKILENINKEQITDAVKMMLPDVEAIAVSGVASVRNPVLEQRTKAIINEICDAPVVCGHEIAGALGFLERTNTAVINAGLLPIIGRFVEAIRNVLGQHRIDAPVFVVKGDGTIIKIDVIRNTPVDTVLSGPASSIMGATALSALKDAIVSDMGGTTTDTGIVRNGKVELSKDGADVGRWKIRIRSAKLLTFGLGGDSRIRAIKGEKRVTVGPERVLPSCRGGNMMLTPTDVLHYTGEFVCWDPSRSLEMMKRQAQFTGLGTDEYAECIKDEIAGMIDDHISTYEDRTLPVCAIGAPAKTWYNITSKRCGFELVIPEHFEVANAVGTASAGICTEAEAVVRMGSFGGYSAHTRTEMLELDTRESAIIAALKSSKNYAEYKIKEQNLQVSEVTYQCECIYLSGEQVISRPIMVIDAENIVMPDEERNDQFLESRIKVIVNGVMFE